MICTLTHRADTIITEPQDKEEEKDNIKKALKKCGYPEWAFTVASIKKDKNLRKEDSAEGNNKRKRPSVTLPYVQGTSEALRRILTKHGVQVHLKPYNTLRQFLVNPKDPKPKEDMAGAIYYIPCGECDASYVGETERPFKKRLQEHKRPSNKSSPVVEHQQSAGHRIDETNIKIIEKEEDWFKRGVKEAVHIRANKCNLNRDRGRHHLPAVYNPSIRSHVTPVVSCDH